MDPRFLFACQTDVVILFLPCRSFPGHGVKLPHCSKKANDTIKNNVNEEKKGMISNVRNNTRAKRQVFKQNERY